MIEVFRLSARRRRREALARSGIINRIGRLTSRRTRGPRAGAARRMVIASARIEQEIRRGWVTTTR
jgi:hypothetical protein